MTLPWQRFRSISDHRGKKYKMRQGLCVRERLLSSFGYEWVKEVFWADQRDLGRTSKATYRLQNVNKPYISFDT